MAGLTSLGNIGKVDVGFSALMEGRIQWHKNGIERIPCFYGKTGQEMLSASLSLYIYYTKKAAKLQVLYCDIPLHYNAELYSRQHAGWQPPSVHGQKKAAGRM